jgi:hypothetical protein
LQIVLEVLKGGLDLDQLDIELPQLGRVPAEDIGPRDATPFSVSSG